MEVNTQGAGLGEETAPYSNEDLAILENDEGDAESIAVDRDQILEQLQQDNPDKDPEQVKADWAGLEERFAEQGWELHNEDPGEGWEEVSEEEMRAIAKGEKYESKDGGEEDYEEEGVYLSDDAQSELVETIGGEENLRGLQEWGVQNLDQDEVDAYNREVNSGDYTRARNAVQSMYFAWQQDRGTEPDLLGGRISSTRDVYRSVQEVEAAMNDPRYLHDTAYTRDVEEKLSRSDVLSPR